jgi:magnesium transporter
MNFNRMPELQWTYGYPIVMGLMATACAGLFIGFKRSGWL